MVLFIFALTIYKNSEYWCTRKYYYFICIILSLSPSLPPSLPPSLSLSLSLPLPPSLSLYLSLPFTLISLSLSLSLSPPPSLSLSLSLSPLPPHLSLSLSLLPPPPLAHHSCKVGVAGVNCDTCGVGFFNLTLGGCEECGCDSVGSEDSLCDNEGQCNCKVQ